jgi:hypothetical protein
MIEVIADDAEFSSSNALMEWLGAARRSAGEVMAAMHEGVERWRALMTARADPSVAASVNSLRSASYKTAVHWCYDSPCGEASPTVAVMLHLRSCYVSKAAILTIPVRSVPVENRSPT